MAQLAQRAFDATKQLKTQFLFGLEGSTATTPDASRPVQDRIRIQLYQFGIGVLASNFVGTAVNASEDSVSTPSVSMEYVRKLAIANNLAAPVIEWEVPTIEHNWTPESCRIRKLVKEFNEATHADY